MRNKQQLIVVLVLMVGLCGCAIHKTGTNGSPVAVTWLEEANSDNAQISAYNRAAAQGLVAALQNGFIEKESFDSISKQQINITRAKEKLTPLLKSQSIALSNSDQIRSLTNEISLAAVSIIQSGSVGIKNDPTKAAISGEIQACAALANSIFNGIMTLKGEKP
jgi:hypothetical protein